MSLNLWRLPLPFAYMVALYALSSIPGDQTPDTLAGALFMWVEPQWQNLLHVPLYGGLTASWLWAMGTWPLSRNGLLIISLLLAGMWGLLDEIHQANVPGRYGSITDMLLNICGAILAVSYAGLRHFPTGKPDAKAGEL